MHRNFSVVLGALALALVALRGGLRGEVATDVLREGMLAMLVFMVIGAITGRIADYLVQQQLETQFRHRVAVFQKELREFEEANNPPDES